MLIWLLFSHGRQERRYNTQRRETIFYQVADDEKIPIAQILNGVFL